MKKSAMEEIRQIALKYENDLTGAAGAFEVPPTNKITVDINTVFAAVDEYDTMHKICFALEGVIKDLHKVVNDTQEQLQQFLSDG